MNKSVTPAPPKPRQNGRIHELSKDSFYHCCELRTHAWNNFNRDGIESEPHLKAIILCPIYIPTAQSLRQLPSLSFVHVHQNIFKRSGTHLNIDFCSLGILCFRNTNSITYNSSIVT